nr:MAG TPA: hypothetical protein [Caudoviricetes sp.]
MQYQITIEVGATLRNSASQLWQSLEKLSLQW